MPSAKTTQRSSKKTPRRRRPRFEVPDGCGALADAVYAKLRNGEADFTVQFVIWELEEALAFLEDLPEDADMRDLDLETNYTWGKEALQLIRERQSA